MKMQQGRRKPMTPPAPRQRTTRTTQYGPCSTGVIVTGYGTPPGGGRAYRATVLIDDPALDARSLNLALQTQGGPVSAATARAVEDAILSRAREMRIADNKF